MIYAKDCFKELRNMRDVYPKIREALKLSKKSPRDKVEFIHLGLDLAQAYPIILATLIQNNDDDDNKVEFEDIYYKGLIIDPECKEIATHCTGKVSGREAKHVIESLNDLLGNTRDDLKKRNMQIELKAYSRLPVLHGFCIDRKILFFSLTEIEKGTQLSGGLGNYLSIEESSATYFQKRFLGSFLSWFDFYWRESRTVCSSEKTPL
jgi:hypothetical protein